MFHPNEVYFNKITGFNYQIFNYFVITIAEWNEYLILCRGLIIDPVNKSLVATACPKFFNFSEFSDKVRAELVKRFEKESETIQINEKSLGYK